MTRPRTFRPAPLLLCALVALWACSEPAMRAPAPTIDPEQIRAHLTRLVAAQEAGAGAGGAGERLAVDYLADAFTAAGLKVQRQPVRLTQITPKVSSIEVTGGASRRTLAAGTDFVAWTRRHAPLTAADAGLVFVGYGISAPHDEWDDYKDVDVRGKIVLILLGDPHNGDRHLLGETGHEIYGRQTYKFEEAERRGAAGAFLIHVPDDVDTPWSVIQETSMNILDVGAPETRTNHLPVEGWMTNTAATALFADAGQNFVDLHRLAEQTNFKAVDLALRAKIDLQNELASVTGTNVVAVLDGSAPAPDYVLYASQWNDLPEGGPTGAQLTDANPGNQPPPGAAIAVEVARALARERDRPHSFVFVVTTAEPEGLEGLKYYLENPLYPLARTRAAINITGFNVQGAASRVATVGAGYQGLRILVREQATEQFRGTSEDHDPERLHYFGPAEDFYTDKGVPCVFVTSLPSTFPKPGDNPAAPADMSTGVLDARLLFHVGRRVASAGNWPDLNPAR